MDEDRQMRRLPRFQIQGVTGAITTPQEAEVINLSLGGALVEHQGMLRVGGVCLLDLPVPGEPLTVRCRVVHSGAVRRDRDGTLYYRTGIEFLDLTPEAEQALEAFIRSYGAPSQ